MNSISTPMTSPVGSHVTNTEAETEQLATAFAQVLSPGNWVGLIGPLGSGKSVFARAVGRAWGVDAAMPSPTYTLMNCLAGRCPIYHMDLYRIESADELDFAGLTPYFSSSGICLVEWAEKAHSLWPAKGWTVTFHQLDESSRRIEIAPLRSSN